jgi:predicted aconitase with swiveling domain
MSIGRASVLVGGEATGKVLWLARPLSLWGGVDVTTGTITSRGHPQAGASVAGRIVVLPVVIGSSSSSSVLAELLRTGRGPAGLVLGRPDSILTVGSIVAQRMYGMGCPIVVLDAPGIEALRTAGRVSIRGGVVSHTAAPDARSL